MNESDSVLSHSIMTPVMTFILVSDEFSASKEVQLQVFEINSKHLLIFESI